MYVYLSRLNLCICKIYEFINMIDYLLIHYQKRKFLTCTGFPFLNYYVKKTIQYIRTASFSILNYYSELCSVGKAVHRNEYHNKSNKSHLIRWGTLPKSTLEGVKEGVEQPRTDFQVQSVIVQTTYIMTSETAQRSLHTKVCVWDILPAAFGTSVDLAVGSAM